MKSENYRGYVIEPNDVVYRKQDTYQFSHVDDTDGGIDFAESIEACKQKIDDLIDEDENSICVCVHCLEEVHEQGFGGNDGVTVCSGCREIEGETKYISEWEYENK